jgi:hypothetical protein
MRKVLATGAVLGSLLTLTTPAHAQQCTVPNTLVNGQIADATEVMDNFNAIAACVDATRDDAVTHDGTPDPGEIAVFASPTAITGGDLTGDVTTSGSTATTLAPTGVTPGTYTSATITVDAKGRVTEALNGALANGGGGWAILYANPALTNPTPSITVDVTGYNDVLVIGRRVTAAASGYRGVLLSVDGGTTFYNTSGNYEYIPANGAAAATFIVLNHSTSTSSARSFGGMIHGLRLPGTPKFAQNATDDLDRWFVASYDPVTHIRIAVVAGSGTADIAMTGGEVFVLGR